jgi:16S rRNA (adenine1518-N6/adenine1519-N6)-dimethyltransferase
MDKSQLGQHFLINEKVLDKIISVAELTKKDKIVEVGAGRGVLTKELSKFDCISFEIDIEMKKFLKDYNVVYGDVLKLIKRYKFNKLVANIPYHITEGLFNEILKVYPEKVVLLIGENFVNLLEGDSKWKFIVNSFYSIKKVMNVDKFSFDPRPRVGSYVIVLDKKEKITKVQRLVKSLILQSDKKLKNALINALVLDRSLTKNEAKALVLSLKLSENLQERLVSKLSNAQFKLVYDRMSNI